MIAKNYCNVKQLNYTQLTTINFNRAMAREKVERMKKQTFTGTLTRNKRKNCSYYGNPKFWGVFENENGETLSGTTATDASCGYSFLNNRTAEKVITYHETKTGNIIFFFIEEV